MDTNILLESGTNELEILEFTLGDNHYGINVAKIREILSYQKVTPYVYYIIFCKILGHLFVFQRINCIFYFCIQCLTRNFISLVFRNLKQ